LSAVFQTDPQNRRTDENWPARSVLSDATFEHRRGHRRRGRQSRSGGKRNCSIMITPGFLAGAFRIGEENSIRALIPSGSTAAQVLIYFGALFLVALAVFAWAVFRTQHRRRHSHHNRLKPASKHQRQSKHLPRNPTLAEAGGLPPVRTEKQPPSPA
jgi:hypothetical protein